MTITFDTPAPVLVRIEFGAGTVSIDAADTLITTVELEPIGDDRASRDAAEATIIEHHGEEVLVKVPRRWRALRAPRLALRMTVPAASRLSAEIGSADVVAAGRYGATEISAGSGDVSLATVDGDARLTSGSGDIAVGLVTGASRLRSGSGSVRVDDTRGSMHVSSGSGDVTVAHLAADFTGKTGSGNVRVDHAGGAVAMSSGSGSLRVGRIGDGEVSAKTASGDVEVGVADGVAAWLDLQTISGRLDNTLEESGPPARGEPVVKLSATTVSGDMRVHRV